MDLRYLREIIEKTSPIPFLGVFEREELEKLEIPLANFCCLLVDRKNEHYTIGGRYKNSAFHFDSSSLQNKPVCAIYILFYLWTIKSPGGFNQAFGHRNTNSHSRSVSDRLVYGAVMMLILSHQFQ